MSRREGKEGGLGRGEAKGAKGPLSAGQFMPRAGAITVHPEEQHGLAGQGEQEVQQ